MSSEPLEKSYASTGQRHKRPIFWSAPNSAFSGKLRGYIAKSGLLVEERFASEARFHEEIVPLIGYYVIPVLELEDGTLLQDTTETMMYFEKQAKDKIQNSLVPTTPLRKAVAHLINFLGTDGFHKPGMHYRWSYEDRQSVYLDASFADWVAPQPGITRKEQTAYFTSDYLPALGIYKETTAVIEQAWEECLDVLNLHFTHHPYFLGSVPTIADCGFMTMVWAHLARDPVPQHLMRRRAPMVSRWAERMVKSEWFDGGFPTADPSPSATGDSLPETLLPFIKYLLSRVAPETVACINSYNCTVVQSGLKTGDLLDGGTDKPNAHPNCGEVQFDLLGVSVRRMAFVDTAFQFQTFLGALSELPEEGRATFSHKMRECQDTGLFQLRLLGSPIRYDKYRYKLG